MKNDSELGINSTHSKLQITPFKSKAINDNGIFKANAHNFDIMGDGEPNSYINDYMQEINDLIVKNLYQSILGNSSTEMNPEEKKFQDRYNYLSEKVKPSDFKITEQLMNSSNMPMWHKAIKEMQKFEKYSTPSMKIRYLMSSLMIVNNIFSLFQDSKDDCAASADDMLTIFPYIVLKAKINRLLRHIKFIRIFEFRELLVGEKNFVLSKLEISVELIKKFEFPKQEDKNEKVDHTF